MNRSGDVVPWLLSRCGLSGQDLLVITDNLDLPVGRVRLKRGGRSLSHNGIASVVKSIGTTDFLRLYVGIGRPPQGIDVVDHVLGKPEGEEAQALADAYDKATNAIHQLRERPAEQVMNEINGR
jgi:PTH1 family peptidyl-tRNA hydrolase